MKKNLFILLICSVTMSAQVPAGAVGYWPFDNNALDLSGNGNNGTATNTIPYKDRFGTPNMAYKFNGLSSQIVVPNSSFVDVGANEDFSFAIWEKAYNDNNDRSIVIKHLQGNWDGYWIGAYTADPGYCSVPQHIDFYTASGAQQDACSDTTILADSSWHFLTAVYKASSQRNYLYIDGVLQKDTGQSSGILSNNMPLCFGFCACDNSHFFHGVLDDGRMYKRALTHAEILQLYNENNTTPRDTTIIATGIQSLTASTKLFGLYPNPGNGLLSVTGINTAAEVAAEVRNTLGQTVLQTKLNNVSSGIDLQDQAPGIYFISLRSKAGAQILKFIKE